MVPTLKRSNERGFSLVEVLVASAVLVVIVVGVLLLYDRANRSFKTANEAAEMQQNVRVAYDRIVADIRMAGFDYKRGGPMLPGQSAAPWTANRQYAAGTIVTPTPATGRTYRATNAGVSGGIQPNFTGATVVETTATPAITWQDAGGATYEQPDEQIEYAGQAALTVRGNFDYSVNPTADDHGREINLEVPNSRFPVVTTGNDEIVTYALVSNQAPPGTAPNNQSIDMFLDLVKTTPGPATNPGRDAHPGGAAEEPRSITGVDLTNNNPPYTLYRFTFNPDGSQNAIPLADNIRSMHFFYYEDTSGQTPLRDNAATPAFAPNIGGGGAYSPTVAGSFNHPDRLIRRKIRSVRVRLVGMSSQPDRNFQDTSTAVGVLSSTAGGVPVFAAENDPDAINFRRIAVDTLISPRNLGVTGLPQSFLQPPPNPTLTSVCTGYCGIVVVNWDPNTTNPNASFAVMWDTDPAGSFSNVLNAGTSNTFAVDLTQQDLSRTFYFRVRAFNAGGSVFSTNTLSASAINATKPNPPNTLVATGGAATAVPGKIILTWSAPTTNASGAPSCTAGGTPSVSNYLREVQSFRIFRSQNANTNAAVGTPPAPSGTMIADEDDPRITSDGYGNFRFEDDTVACGTPYYYRIRTVEWCERDPAFNTSGSTALSVSNEVPANAAPGLMGISGSAGTPRPPVNVVVDAANSICDSVTNLCRVTLNWSKVTTATNNATIAIDEYEIEREMYDPGDPSATPPVAPFLTTCPLCVPPVLSSTTTFPKLDALAVVGSTVAYTDDTAPMLNPATGKLFEYRYRVRAMQTAPCPDGTFSTQVTFPPPCAFTGSVIVQAGASSGDGLTPQTAWVMNAGDTITIDPPGGTTFSNTDMTIIDPSGVILGTVSSNTNPAAFSWLNLTPGDIYTVTFTMTNTDTPPCVEQIVRYIQQEPLPACALITFAQQNSILSQTATTYQLKLDLLNSATEALNLEEITFDWVRPNNIAWNNIKFPSTPTATIPLGGTPAATFTVPLNPRPAALSTADVIVPADTGSGPGTLSLLLNFAATSGTPANVTASVIPNICVKYTRRSVTVPSGLPSVSVLSLTSVLTTATARTSAPHGLVTGNLASVTGATPSLYSGTFQVTVIDPMTFTYTLTQAAASSPAAGTINVAKVLPFLFNCAIKPDQNPNNPNLCD